LAGNWQPQQRAEEALLLDGLNKLELELDLLELDELELGELNEELDELELDDLRLDELNKF
jgi:hypothetical protein